MLFRKSRALAPATPAPADPFALMRRLAADFDRMIEEFDAPAVRWPLLRGTTEEALPVWAPRVDVFEKDKRLVTRVDLPGLKKEDVKVEVTDGQLTISGERKRETEEKKEDFYRSEREYGSFYRAVPLPEGVKFEDVKATFADGVLEVTVPLPAQAEAPAKRVAIEEPSAAQKTAAA